MQSKMLDRLHAFLNSPEGQASIEDQVKRRIAKDENDNRRIERINALSDEDFERLMQHIIVDNGDKQHDYCRRQWVEPHPTNLLYLVMKAAELLGRDVSDEQEWIESTQYFPAEVIEYRGYFFWAIYGQGVHSRVYNSKRETVIHL